MKIDINSIADDSAKFPERETVCLSKRTKRGLALIKSKFRKNPADFHRLALDTALDAILGPDWDKESA